MKRLIKKFKFNHWQIAYRINNNESFRLIPNPPWAWAADPFLVEFRDEVYLFAELYLYKSERNGVIGYCKYEDGKFGDWIVTMDKHWHLSYPNVFVYENELYMCPESYQKEEVGIYRLIEFPDKWEHVYTLLNNGKYVDTTFLKKNNEIYFFTFRPRFCNSEGDLLLYKINGDQISEPLLITNNKEIARPGGKIIADGERLIRVSQNCQKEYGKELVFSEILSVWPQYQEKVIARWQPDDVVDIKGRRFSGIHTYNRLSDLEVVDLKFNKSSLTEYFSRKRVRKIFLNKY